MPWSSNSTLELENHPSLILKPSLPGSVLLSKGLTMSVSIIFSQHCTMNHSWEREIHNHYKMWGTWDIGVCYRCYFKSGSGIFWLLTVYSDFPPLVTSTITITAVRAPAIWPPVSCWVSHAHPESRSPCPLWGCRTMPALSDLESHVSGRSSWKCSLLDAARLPVLSTKALKLMISVVEDKQAACSKSALTRRWWWHFWFSRVSRGPEGKTQWSPLLC